MYLCVCGFTEQLAERRGSVGGPCENGDEPWGSLSDRECIYLLCHLAVQKGVCAANSLVIVQWNRRFAAKGLQCFGCVG
jgi:hypothetical protein